MKVHSLIKTNDPQVTPSRVPHNKWFPECSLKLRQIVYVQVSLGFIGWLHCSSKLKWLLRHNYYSGHLLTGAWQHKELLSELTRTPTWKWRRDAGENNKTWNQLKCGGAHWRRAAEIWLLIISQLASQLPPPPQYQSSANVWTWKCIIINCNYREGIN